MEISFGGAVCVYEKPTIILQNGGIRSFILEKSYLIGSDAGKRVKWI